MKRLGLLAASLFIATSSWAITTFEDDNCSGFKASNSDIGITAERFKSGKKSLKWQTKESGILDYRFDAKTLAGNFDCFGMWLYNVNKVNGQLKVNFYFDDNLLGSRNYNLNFYGWRPIGAKYSELGLTANSKINRIEFIAPQESATLYIDSIRECFTSRNLLADNQQPWVDNPKLVNLPFEKSHYSTHDISVNREYLPELVKVADIPENVLEDIKTIEKRVFNSKFSHDRPVKISGIEEIEAEFKKLNIVKKDGIITGPPTHWPMVNSVFLLEEDSIEVKHNIVHFLCKIEWAIRQENFEGKERAGEIGALLVEYLLDQGYQENSGCMGWIGNGYGYRYFPPTIFHLKPYLKAAGIWDDAVKMINYYSDGRIMFYETPMVSLDVLCNFSTHLLPAILCVDNIEEKYQRLRAYKLFNDKIIACNNPFGNDGSIHHHTGHHLAYGAYSLPSYLATQLKRIEGTSFQISDENVKKMHRLGYALAMQVNDGVVPPNLSMRAGEFLKIDINSILYLLSTMRDDDNQMKELFLGTNPPPHLAKIAEDYKKMGVKPKETVGFFTLNFAPIAMHKRLKWSVNIGGTNNKYRGLEIYGWQESNNYARYARNGSVIINKDGDFGFDKDYAGWNWSFWPGATSVVRPEEELFDGYMMYGNRNDFSCGVGNTDGNGVWGTNYSGIDIAFLKSVFCFDNVITVITSDVCKDTPIPADSTGGIAVTTLLQQQLSGDENISINGKAIGEMPYSSRFDGKDPITITDTMNNGYYIWPLATPIEIKKSTQEWLCLYKRHLKDANNNPTIDIRKKIFKESPIANNFKYYNTTKDDYALAYFDMGKNPINAKCAYSILIDYDKEQTQKFADNPTVELLKNDSKQHVVHDNLSKTTGYVVFSKFAKLPAPLAKVSCPATILVKDEGDVYNVNIALSNYTESEDIVLTFANGTKKVFKGNFPLSTNFKINKTQGDAK